MNCGYVVEWVCLEAVQLTGERTTDVAMHDDREGECQIKLQDEISTVI